jgi:3-deoxy-7-phosphoheptulonate synthase
MGAMIESNLKSGSQHVIDGQPLIYGKSITDGCLSWEETVPLLKTLANAVQKRRLTKSEAGANI